MRAARGTALVFALCFITACESEEAYTASQTAAPSVPSQPPIGSWVRVNQRKLYMAPSADAHLVVDSKEPYRLAEVLGYPSDKFVHLRTLAVHPEVLCGTSSGNDQNFELQFFAPLDALRPVLNRPKVVEFDDGARLEFRPGVPVDLAMDLAADEARLQIGEVEFVVPVSPDEVRNWFPVPDYMRLGLGIPVQWSRDRPLYYGERSVASFKAPFVFARGRQKLDDGAELLTFADSCGRYTLRAEPGPAVFESKPPSHGDPIIAKPDKQPDPCIEQRTQHEAVLTWATSDRAAGWIYNGIALPPSAREHDGKVCFTAVELSVCLASEKIHQEERRDCRERREREGSPRVKFGEPSVSPGLDPTIVYGIAKAHIGGITSCYKAGLTKQPGLAGRLVIEFEISTDGRVERSSVVESTLGPDETVSTCLAKATKRWDFSRPEYKPSSGPVRVVFPFELSPLASADEE